MTEATSSAEDRVGALRSAVLGRSPDCLIIVDFDETLWLRNSTEEYLRSLRPWFLAAGILLVLDIVRPWEFIARGRKEHVYRDWLRVVTCSVLLPWSIFLWRRRAPELARRWKNDELIEILARAGPAAFHVATLGTDAIVAPLLRHIDPRATLIAAGTLWSGHRIRDLGKKAWIEQRHGPEKLRSAIVITDSEGDADLLAACETPVLVKWPRAEYRPAMSDAYIPFLYTQRGKRAGENYMLYGVVLEDLVLLCLAFAWLMPSPVLGVIGITMLHLSFWVVYETGYVENDVQAVRREASPQVWKNATLYGRRVKTVPALLTSLAFAVIGIWLLTAFNVSSVTFHPVVQDRAATALLALAMWITYLAAARGAFALYNRMDVQSRAYFYVILQLFRTLGYGIFMTTNLIGAFALLALVFARWVKYLVYRDVGRTLAENQRFLMLLFFLVLGSAGLAVEGTTFLTLQTLAVFAWLALYSHRRLREVATQTRDVNWGRSSGDAAGKKNSGPAQSV